MRIGYIRVSRDKQTTALQEDAIKQAECKRVFVDKMSGVRDDRPEFLRMLDMARPGDVMVVWRLDRLGRSLRHLIETINQLRACFGKRRKPLAFDASAHVLGEAGESAFMPAGSSALTLVL